MVANRFAPSPDPPRERHALRLLRPGTAVELVESQVPPLRGTVQSVETLGCRLPRALQRHLVGLRPPPGRRLRARQLSPVEPRSEDFLELTV